MSTRFSRAVVTGGAGFLGSHLCEQLLRRGTGVVCLDNFLTGTPANISHLIGEPRFQVIKCDVTNFVHVPGEVDLVVHMASAASPADYLRLPIETLKVGGLGTLHTLGLAGEKGARFVLASTSEVYGDPQQHPASAGLAAPFRDSAVLVADGRGESISYLAGSYHDGELTVLATQQLPHSLGLMYEEVTEHLGFLRSSDEYKVMALASYGRDPLPRLLPELRKLIEPTGDGGFVVHPIEWSALAKRRHPGGMLAPEHIDLAAGVQARLEEVLLELARWLHGRTGRRRLTMAGGVALNCVANTRLAAEGPFDELWVQPAAGDAGTALGGALHLAQRYGEPAAPMPGADLGRGFTDDELAAWLDSAQLRYERPSDVAVAAADALADDAIVAWFQGRSEFGPRALGHRSLLAHPGHAGNLDRLNAVKGREQFRPIAPMVLADRAGELFGRGPIPSPYMLFVHDVAPHWRDRIPAVVHVDGTARIQTVDRGAEPMLARLLDRFAERTGLPTVVNTSLNTAGRPMVDDPRDALECFGSAPVDVLVLGPFLLRRAEVTR